MSHSKTSGTGELVAASSEDPLSVPSLEFCLQVKAAPTSSEFSFLLPFFPPLSWPPPPAQSSLSLNTFLTVATPADPWIFPHMAGWKDIFAWLFAITCQLPLIMGTVLMCAHCTTKIHILCSEAQRKLMHDVVREPLVG